VALGQLVGQGQERGALLAELGAGALVAAPGSGALADLGALLGWDAVKLVAAGLAAGEDPGRMELAAGAAAGSFAAFAAHQVEGAWGHGLVRAQGAHSSAQGAVGAPELLAESGGGGRLQSVSIYIYIDTDSKENLALG
jgi:hypothetical protein